VCAEAGAELHGHECSGGQHRHERGSPLGVHAASETKARVRVTRPAATRSRCPGAARSV
jgi:hypothetical protein